MSASDTDEDLGEEDYAETNVLLGYASRDGDPDTVSRLGGRPNWLEEDSPPSGAVAKCKTCLSAMVLLLQLNGELPERFPGHERRLYVFSCRRPGCSRKEGSIRAIRGTKVSKAAAAGVARTKAEEKEKRRPREAKGKEDEEQQQTQAERAAGLGDSLFGGSGLGSATNPLGGGGASRSNPFARRPAAAVPTNSSDEASSSLLPQTFAAALSLNASPTSDSATTTTTGRGRAVVQHNDSSRNGGIIINGHRKVAVPQEPWPAESTLPRAYPVLYLADAEYEALDPRFLTQIPGNARVLESVTDDGAEPGNERDVFESSMDLTFQKFADRMAQNPEQVIRYEFGGRPLLYSKNGARMPKCDSCGSARVFEVQLTPHAIAELEADEIGFDGMEWGTIIVGVCEKDCVPEETEDGVASYAEEWVCVQWEEETNHQHQHK